MEKEDIKDLKKAEGIQDLRDAIIELLKNDMYNHDSSIRIELYKDVYMFDVIAKSDTEEFNLAEKGHIDKYGHQVTDEMFEN